MSTLIVIPVLNRPHRIKPTVESIAESTPEEHRVLFVATEGQDDVIAALEENECWYVVLRPNYKGDYAKKINHAYAITDDEFIFLGADDLKFHPGWLSAALKVMERKSIGVVGTQDMGSPRVINGEHATHFLVRRGYIDARGTIDEPGKILHEGYPHEFVDDELIGTAKKRRAYAFAGDSWVEHLHPDWGKAPSDATYKESPARITAGRDVFMRRSLKWK